MLRRSLGQGSAIALISAAIAALVLASGPDSGTWTPLPALLQSRGGATATLLPDGTLLVAGGRSGGTVLDSVERFDLTTGPVTAAHLLTARADHTATALIDGRVLIAGGTRPDGSATDSVELYTPATGDWTPLVMTAARTHHTATLLPGGRVLIAGGDAAGAALATCEIFDPLTNTFMALPAVLPSGRTRHAAATLPDGQVLVAGGSDGAATLTTTAIINPVAGTVTTGPAMGTARANFTATALLDGDVLLVGGNDGTGDLATAERYVAATGAIAAISGLQGSRQGHVAVRLPANNGVLIAGGTAGGQALQSAELFLPASAQFVLTETTGSGHVHPVASTTATAGRAMLAGGDDTAAAEAFHYATVQTDKDDYAPFTPVVISGSGWLPGEIVTLSFQELPDLDAHSPVTAVADASGHIENSDFFPDWHDLGITFILTARGQYSEAQATFKDNRTINFATLASAGSSVTYPAPGGALSVGLNATVAVTVNVTTDATGTATWAATGYRISTTAPGTVTCVNHTDHTTAGVFSETFNVAAPATAGTYNFYAIAYSNNTCTTNASTTLVATGALVVGNVGVASIVRAAANPSNAASVTWTATFNTTVTGVDVTDFALAQSGGVSGATLTSVTGSGNTYTVTAGTGSGNGSLGLNVVDNDTIVNGTNRLGGTGAGNGNFTGQVYTIDRTAPTVLSIVRAGASPTADSTVPWTVTFSENVTGVDAGDFALASSGLGGAPAISGVSGSGSVYTVTAGTGTGTGTLGLNIVDDDSIADAAANKLGGTGVGNGSLTGQVYSLTRTLTPNITASSKPYDGTAAATILTRTLTGTIAAGDVVSLTGGTATFANPNAGTAKTVTATGLTLAGANAAAYLLSATTATTSADITPRPVTVTADPLSKGTGTADPALTYAITAGSLASGDSFSGALTRAAGESAGTYAITQGTLSAGPNYALTFVGANLTIVGGVGVLELATSTNTRPLLTPTDLQAFLPERGQFTFPAPYNTTGVRLTNQTDCSVWYDCVNTPTGGSWRNMNNSAGSNFLYVVLGLDKSNGGIGPSLFRYDKTTGETLNLGGLFDADDDRNWGSLDGWYFSPSLATKFYIGLDQQLSRYDILTHTTTTVFDTTAVFGDDKEIYHAQSSQDDRVHSFTLRLINNYQPLGCGVYREDTQQFAYFPAVGTFHECQIDKSGQWLLIKEDRDNSDGEDNRIVNLYTGAETVLLRTAGAAGSSDNGFGTMLAVDATAPLPGTIRTWGFGPLAPGPVVYHGLDGLPPSFTQISFANARSASLDQQYACGGVANRGNGPRANEIACVRLDGSLTTLTIAPTMTDLDALGGGANDDLIKQPFGNLDPTGQFFLWTTNLLGDRIDAFLVRVPALQIVTPPADAIAPVVAITTPADATTVSGTASLTAVASDNVAVAGVQYQVDGANLGAEITSAPFNRPWDTTTAADGVHVLTARARDAAGNFTMSLPVAVTVLNTPAAPQISGVSATGVIERLATVRWTTNQLADSLVEYGLTTAYGTTTTLNPALVATHLQTLTGLATGTTYHYRVTSKNAQNVSASSADFTFTTLAAPAITAVGVSAITDTSATVSWTTDIPSDSLVEFGATTGYGDATNVDEAFVTAHLQGLYNLDPGTTYHFRVYSTTPEGVLSVSADFTFTTVGPPALSGIGAFGLTHTTATVGWTTDHAATSEVEYGLTAAYGSTTGADGSFVTTHGRVLTGLTAGTTYHYRVSSHDGYGLTSTSGDLTFTTVDPAAPAISAVTASGITGSAATIGWTTDQIANSQVEYGLTAAYGTSTPLNASLVSTHSVPIGGLVPGATYHYRALSGGSTGPTTASDDFTFTTVAPPAISAVGTSGITGTSATINWTTDQLATSQLDYGLTTAYGASTTLDPTGVTAHSQALTGLSLGTAYHYRVRSTNTVGLTTTSADSVFSTIAVPVITGVGASGVTGTAAAINWTSDQATDSQVEYGVTTAYGTTTTLDASLVTAHAQNLTGLSTDTTYHYRVRSANSVGLLATSADGTFTTAAIPIVSGVSAASITGTAAAIGWTTDQSADSQVEYGLTTAYGTTTTLNAALVTSHSQNLSGLTTGTTYHYRVRSTNSVGLLATSADGTFATVAVPVISGVGASGLTGAAATIAWTTDQAADSQIDYGLTSAYGSTTTLNAALVTAHSQNLTGLTNGTTYHYRVRSTNSVGLLATSADATFTTVAVPVVSAVSPSGVTGTAATVGWTTDQTADSQVEYGLTTTYGTTTTLNAALVTSHSQNLSGLTTGTTYHYRVRSTNSVGLLATSADGTFTTVAVPIISAVSASGITGTAASIGWTTDQSADSQVEYGLTTAYGTTTTLNAALVTAHSQNLAGLSIGTTYHYRVRSTNSVGLLATSPDATLTTVATPVISAVNASGLTSTSETINWSTDQAANSQVEYGLTTAYGGSTTLDATLVTAHSQSVAGLTIATTYHYRVRSTNSVGLLATSADATFTTAAVPVVSGVTVSGLTGTAATIGWTTDQTADSQVEYGLTTAYGTTTTLNATLVTAHSQNLAGLTVGATYHYRVRSMNSVGLLGTSADATFTTVALPVISAVTASALTGTTATITWTTDQTADSQIDYGVTTAYGTTTTLNATLVTAHSQNLTGLTVGTTYHYRVRSTNSVGLLATSADATFATVAVPVISGVNASAVTGTAATIGWTTDQAADSQVEYGLTTTYGTTTTLNATLVTAHSQNLAGLTPGTLYHYRVRSTNSVGLLATSADATVTTVAVPVISGVGSSSITGTAATIAWTTNQNADSQVEYGLTTTYGTTTTLNATLVTAHSQNLAGLTPGTLYHYRVRSTNSVGLLATSADATLTTVALPVISGVAVSAITGTAATIGWTTDQTADSQVEYGLTTTYGTTTTLNAALVTAHSQSLAGLTAGTLYHYRVRSTNSVGLLATSADATLTTVAVPVISAVSASGLTGTAATITWTTDQTADSQVEYGLTTTYGTTTTLNATLVTAHSQGLSGLTVGTTYHYRVRSTNSVGLLATSPDATFATIALPVISGMNASGLTGTAATITWTTDQTADSQVDYGVTTTYGSTTTLNATLVTAHSQNVAGLTVGTTYHYRVRSTNSVGLLAISADATFATIGVPVISGVGAVVLTATTAAVNWTTDQTADSQVEYGLTTTYGSSTTLNATLVTAHSQNLSGLTTGSTYHYRVRSTNSVGLLAISGDFTFTVNSAPVISALSATGVTGTSATINWTTDQTANTQVEYGLTSAYGSSTTLNATLVTAHSQSVAGLTAGTTYHFRVRSTNGIGLLAVSGDFTITAIVAPVIFNVSAASITGTGATISWSTDQTADTQVEYGLTTTYGTTTTLNAALVTQHSQSVTGLATGTTYHYRVRSTNGAGLLATSADVTLGTLVPPARSILVVSPHPDDDTLITSGILAAAVAQGASVKVAYMTNGDASPCCTHGTALGLMREAEAVTGESYLGVAESNLLFLGYPDSYLAQIASSFPNSNQTLNTAWGQSTTYANRGLGSTSWHQFKFGSAANYNGANIITDLKAILTTYRPDDIYTTAEFDQHLDHSSTYNFVKTAITQVAAADSTYRPILHKSVVHTPGEPAWPGSTPNPQAAFTEPPGLSGTSVTWATREDINVPVAMQNPDLGANPKARAIASHISQNGFSDPLLAGFLRNDEFFWREVTTTPTPVLSVTPSPTAFGNRAVGATASLTITIANTGNAALTLATPILPSAPFGATGLPASGTVIAAGGNVTATVTFTPTSLGAVTGMLVLQSNGGNFYLTLTGTGTVAPAAILTATPNPVAFGTAIVGTTASRSLIITNTGNTALTVNSVTAPSAPFGASGLPANGTVIAAGASVTSTITFTPAAATAFTGSLVVQSTAGTVTVNLSGTGRLTQTLPAPTAGGWQLNGSASIVGSALQLTPASTFVKGSAYWPTAVSSSNLTITYDATESGGTGADGMSFNLISPSAGATALGDSGGALGFAPVNGVAVTMDTYQNGSDPAANFVGIATGTTGPTDTFVYAATNTTVPNLRSGSHHYVVTTGAGRIQVRIDGTLYIDTAVTLPNSVLVGFSGATGGLTDNHSVSNVVIVAEDPTPRPVLALSPNPVAFGTTTVATTATRTITITNTGSAPMTITGFTAPSAPFGVTGLPVIGSVIVAGGSVTATVTFTPAALGAASGSLILQTDGGNVTVSLTGTGG